MAVSLDTKQLLQFMTLTQAAPAQNTWYTLCDLYNVTVVNPVCLVIQTTGETLEIRYTIDGVVSNAATQVAVAATQYTAHLNTSYNGQLFVLIDTINPKGFGMEWFSAHHIKVEVRKTTAAGGGTLQAGLAYIQN
jgi:hypothetical protein